MYVRFNQRYLAFRPGDETHRLAYGVALELAKRGIVTLIEDKPPEKPKRKRKNVRNVRKVSKTSRKRPTAQDRNSDSPK